MSLYTWIIIIVSIITICVVIYLKFHYDMKLIELYVVFVLGGLFFMTISTSNESKQPKPIDVYRGKTTLKIYYIDSIPQDTLVLWKNTTLI